MANREKKTFSRAKAQKKPAAKKTPAAKKRPAAKKTPAAKKNRATKKKTAAQPVSSRATGHQPASDRERLLAVLDSIDDVIYVADTENYELLHVNETFKKTWGEDVLGKKCYRVIQGRDTPCPFCTNDKLLGEYRGRTYVWEFQNEITKNWYRCADKAIEWENGRTARFELASDITALKTAEQQVVEEQGKISAFLDNTADLVTVVNPDGTLRYVNKASRRIYGLEPEEMVGTSAFDSIHPDDKAATQAAFQDWIAKGVSHATWENRQISVTGEVHDMVWTIMPKYEAGELESIWSIAHDITERKQMEADLKERIKELRCLQSISKIVEDRGNDVEGILQDVVETLPISWLHVEAAVARIRLDDRVFSTGDIDRCRAIMRAVLRIDGTARGAVEVGYLGEQPEQDDGPFLSEERALIDAVAERLGHVIERVDYEAELREYQAHLEEQVAERTRKLQHRSSELTTIMDSVPGLVFYKDTENRYIRVNQYVADAHHMTKDELEGQSCFDLYPKEQAQAYLDDDLTVIRSGKPKLNFEEPWHTEAGERWVSTSKIPFFDEEGKVVGIIGVSMDITERKRAEQALERKSRITDAVNRVFREALTCETEEAVAQAALKVAEELTGSKFGFIGEINDEGCFDTIGISNPGWGACAIEGSNATMLIRGMKLRGIWASVLKSGQSQVVNDPAAHPDRVGVPPGHPPLTGFLGVPFTREGRAVGMIALANKDGPYSDDDRTAIETLAGAFHETLIRKRLEIEVKAQSLLKSMQAELGVHMRGDLSTEVLARNVITYLCAQLKMPCGLFYTADEHGTLRRTAGYAHRPKKTMPDTYRPGEGLVGQAALDKQTLHIENVPNGYFAIESGLGETLPKHLYIIPVVHENRVRAVIELGTLVPFSESETRFLNALTESIAFAVESARARERQSQLLEESQRLTEELQTQQEELKAANEELEEQTARLAESELRLKAQHEELEVSNEELEEKNELLAKQKREVERAQAELAERAEDLAMASKYKSEFLANMSHELRTPLNSLLLLARSLSENKEGSLTPDDVEAAEVIYQSGNDLLALINEILDLSKIEAGRMALQIEEVHITELAESVRKDFGPTAKEKGLALEVVENDGAPRIIASDGQRIEQVLRNLVGNAIKFTREGSVTVTFGPGSDKMRLRHRDVPPAETLRIDVRDTGIGIPPDRQKVIFEAFQQADGGTSRQYGGTGLGLSIARELMRMLDGEIRLESTEGKGATFTVLLPRTHQEVADAPGRTVSPPAPRRLAERTTAVASAIPDDRESLKAGDRVILIIEDDTRFSEVLARQCRAQGLKILAAGTGETGVELARQYGPAGVLLDLKLPGMDGTRVLELLKENPETRHIPVHIISGDDPSPSILGKGAIGFDQKPVTPDQIARALNRLEETATRKTKRVLVVEDNEESRRAIVKLIADDQVQVDEVAGGGQAIEALRQGSYDCVILDLGLWDFDGDELLKKAARDPDIHLPPVIIYTARDLTWEENLELRSYSDAIIVKGVRSDERLLDEVTLFLHRVVAEMPEKKRQVITSLHDTDALLRGKKILIVDDDMRTLFALTKILSDREVEVIKAENGEKALEKLETTSHVDLVLMDIMMPVLDGYETMKRIRAQEQFRDLPIIALTAKVMKGDQERCIEAGANDYLPKPIDQDRLVSMLRVWLYR